MLGGLTEGGPRRRDAGGTACGGTPAATGGLLSPGDAFAGFDVEFAGGEDGDFLDGNDFAGAPEGGHAGVHEFVAEVDGFLLEGVAGDGGEEDDGLALFVIGDADHGDFAFGFAVEAEDLGDGGFDGFVGDHFAGDFGEAGDAAFDDEEAVVVHAADIAGFEPAVLDDALGEVGAVEVAEEDVAALHPDDAGLVEGGGFFGGGVGDADGDAWEEVADGAVAVLEELRGIVVGGGGGGGEVDVGGGGGFGEAVAFEGEDAEFLLEGLGEAGGEFFGAGDDEAEGGELLGFDAAHVAAEEGGGGEEEVNLVLRDEFGEAFGFHGAGVGDQVDALDDGEPEGDGAAEGVEEGEAAEDAGVFVGQGEGGAELTDVGEDVAVAEGDALGFAGGAGGEEEDGFVIAAAAAEAEHFGEEAEGEDLAEDGPLDDLILDAGEDALDEEKVAIGRPGEAGDFAHEGIGSDEAVEVGLTDGGLDGVPGGGEVEVDGDLAGEEDGEVGEHAGFAGGEDDADAGFAGGEFDLLGEGDGGTHEFVVGEGAVVAAVVEGAGAAPLFEAGEEGFGEGAVEEPAGGEGAFGGFEEAFAVAGDGGQSGGDGMSGGDDGGGEFGGGVDGEGALAGDVDGEGGHGEPQIAKKAQLFGGNVAGGAGAGDGVAGDEDEEAAVLQFREEGGADLGRRGVVLGKGGGEDVGAGEVVAGLGFDEGIFLDQPGDGASGEALFESEQFAVAEATGDDEGALGREAFQADKLCGSS